MNQEEFYPPFERLTLAFNRLAFLSERERAILTEDWFQSFKRYDVSLWERGVDTWKMNKAQFPSQAEMHDLLLDLAPRMHLEDLERQREEERASRPPLTAEQREQIEQLKAKMRGLKASMQLQPPAPSDAPGLTDGDR